MLLYELDNPATTRHRVSVTIVDTDSQMVTQRDEPVQKIIRVTAPSEQEAVSRAMSFYKKQGYRVKEANYIGPLPV